MGEDPPSWGDFALVLGYAQPTWDGFAFVEHQDTALQVTSPFFRRVWVDAEPVLGIGSRRFARSLTTRPGVISTQGFGAFPQGDATAMIALRCRQARTPPFLVESGPLNFSKRPGPSSA